LLSWNDQAGTAVMIRGLCKKLSSTDLILVVDNGSKQPFVNEISDDRILIIRSEVNLGYGGGNNLGIVKARSMDARYIFLLNTDVDLPDDLLGRLVIEMEADAELGAVGPVLQEGNQLYYGGEDIGLYLNTRRLSISEHMPLGSYLPGTAILLRASSVESTGLLDEEFFFSGEIADYCRRMQESGFKLKIVSDVKVTHNIEEVSGNLRDSLYLYYSMRNRFLYVKKHHLKNGFSLKLRWLMIIARQCIGAILYFQVGKLRALVYAAFDGISGNFGNRNDRFIKDGLPR